MRPSRYLSIQQRTFVVEQICIMNLQPTDLQKLLTAILSVWPKKSCRCFKHLVKCNSFVDKSSPTWYCQSVPIKVSSKCILTHWESLRLTLWTDGADISLSESLLANDPYTPSFTVYWNAGSSLGDRSVQKRAESFWISFYCLIHSCTANSQYNNTFHAVQHRFLHENALCTARVTAGMQFLQSMSLTIISVPKWVSCH